MATFNGTLIGTSVNDGTERVSGYSGWNYRKKLTFNNSAQSTNLTNFPVLVKLTTASHSDVYANTKVDGTDLRFYDSDDTTLLSYHIELWNASGDSFIWVQVPSITASVNTDYMYMYYGNAGASDSQSETGTYDSNYYMVQHLNEDPSGTAPPMLDSTTGNHDGTMNGAMVTGQLVTSQIGNGLDFYGAGDYIDFDAVVPFNSQLGSVSLWINTTDAARGMIWYGAPALGGNGFGGGNEMHINLESNGTVSFFGEGGATADETRLTSGSALNDGSNHHIAICWDVSALTAYMYVDGVLVDTDTTANINNFDLNYHYIGRPGANTFFYDGIIDEVQVHNVCRSADWIAAQYLSETVAYITFGGQESTNTWSNTISKTAAVNGDKDIIGLIFKSVSIDQATVISSAKLTVTAHSGSSIATTIYGFDEDTAADFSSVSNAPSTRTKTTATVAWTPGAWLAAISYDTTDITTIVQEIVDRVSWANGNSMGFSIEANSAIGDTQMRIYDTSASTSLNATLTIVYSGGGSFEQPLTDTVTISEATAPKVVQTVLSDTITASETIVKAPEKNISDSVSFLEDLDGVPGKQQPLSDTVTISEATAPKVVQKTLSDSVTLSEIFGTDAPTQEQVPLGEPLIKLITEDLGIDTNE